MSRQLKLAWGSLIFSCIGWPATAVMQWAGLPVFEQVMLGLSWLAPIMSSINLLFTANLKEGETSDEHNGHPREHD